MRIEQKYATLGGFPNSKRRRNFNEVISHDTRSLIVSADPVLWTS